ncbi:MAG: SIS domain-containing protein [Candidatus Sericytochromatia bacterium]
MSEAPFEKQLAALIGHIQQIDREALAQATALLAQTAGKIIFLGNGGSNAISSHMAEDWSNNYKPALCFSDTAFMSCFANDFGWEQVFVVWMEKFVTPGQDTVVLISSSGASANILKAADWCQANAVPLITLSGFQPQNPLRSLGEVNFWVDSRSYYEVEVSHHIILHTILEHLMKG